MEDDQQDVRLAGRVEILVYVEHVRAKHIVEVADGCTVEIRRREGIQPIKLQQDGTLCGGGRGKGAGVGPAVVAHPGRSSGVAANMRVRDQAVCKQHIVHLRRHLRGEPRIVRCGRRMRQVCYVRDRLWELLDVPGLGERLARSHSGSFA